MTKARGAALRKAIAAGKTIYTEKPTAESVEEALELARLANAAGVQRDERDAVGYDVVHLAGDPLALGRPRLADPGRHGVRTGPLGLARVLRRFGAAAP